MKNLENLRYATRFIIVIYLLLMAVFFYNEGFSIDEIMLNEKLLLSVWVVYVLGLLLGFVSEAWGGFFSASSIIIRLLMGGINILFVAFLIPCILLLICWRLGRKYKEE